MNRFDSTAAQQIANAVSAFQKQSIGHAPQTVTVVPRKGSLVITIHVAVIPAVTNLARGAAQVQEIQRQLIATSSELQRQGIKRINVRQVRDAAAEIEPTTASNRLTPRRRPLTVMLRRHRRFKYPP